VGEEALRERKRERERERERENEWWWWCVVGLGGFINII